MKSKPWKMPLWMTVYAPWFVNTGGNNIEELVNGDTSPGINMPRFVIEMCAKSQVSLLESLRKAGVLQ